MPPPITAITPLKNNPQLAAVHVAGKRVATLRLTVIAQLALIEGADWTATLAHEAAAAQRHDRALRAALQRLDRRALSRARLIEKLSAAGHPPEAIASALDEAQKLGALDDEALAQNLAAELARKHAGPELLRAKLAARGLPAPAIARALAATTASHPPADAAHAFAEKKLAAMKSLAPPVRRRRLAAALARKGHDEDLVQSILEKLLGAEPDPA